MTNSKPTANQGGAPAGAGAPPKPAAPAADERTPAGHLIGRQFADADELLAAVCGMVLPGVPPVQVALCDLADGVAIMVYTGSRWRQIARGETASDCWRNLVTSAQPAAILQAARVQRERAAIAALPVPVVEREPLRRPSGIHPDAWLCAGCDGAPFASIAAHSSAPETCWNCGADKVDYQAEVGAR